MNTYLLNRALGNISPSSFAQAQTTRLIHALQPAPLGAVVLDGSTQRIERPWPSSESRTEPENAGANTGGARTSRSHAAQPGDDPNAAMQVYAHEAGVNDLVIDKFEGRLLLSGGADGGIYLWDLTRETRVEGSGAGQTDRLYHPVGEVVGNEPASVQGQTALSGVARWRGRGPLPGGIGADQSSLSGHRYGITRLTFYPFDNMAFLSSSYDHTLNIYATETLTASATFNLSSVVYSHALSPVASHLLVACATQHPAVRLVDLRSGANTHSLPGHSGAVLSVAWSPRDEHVLASGSVDGTVKLWDIRRSAAALAVLDKDHTDGMTSAEGALIASRPTTRDRTHVGAANGVVWTDRGDHIVTTGHDQQVRVWNAATNANTLANFGPLIRNPQLSTNVPLLAPARFLPPGQEMMFYPNGTEILVFELFEGTLLKRLRPVVAAPSMVSRIGRRNIQARVTSLTWRAGDIEMYSGHADGVIRAWIPRTREDVELEEDEAAKAAGKDLDEDETKKRKRQVLEDVYQDLTRQKITFGLH